MKQHKWHKEIKAWADGAEIEILWGDKWIDCSNPHWGENHNYRIKPQPKKPKYLYIYSANGMGMQLSLEFDSDRKLLGKIKLEVDDE